METETKLINKTYQCPYPSCKGTSFEAKVIYQGKMYNPATGQVVSGRGKKSAYSTQVKCPKCHNFIPTWKREPTDNSIGRKHIHLRS